MESFINVTQSTYRLLECFVMACRWANGMNKKSIYMYLQCQRSTLCVYANTITSVCLWGLVRGMTGYEGFQRPVYVLVNLSYEHF